MLVFTENRLKLVYLQPVLIGHLHLLTCVNGPYKRVVTGKILLAAYLTVQQVYLAFVKLFWDMKVGFMFIEFYHN